MIRNNYIEATGVLAGTATAPKGIDIQDRSSSAYAQVYANTCVEMQWPITFTFWGLSTTPIQRSVAYKTDYSRTGLKIQKGHIVLAISVCEEM